MWFIYYSTVFVFFFSACLFSAFFIFFYCSERKRWLRKEAEYKFERKRWRREEAEYLERLDILEAENKELNDYIKKRYGYMWIEIQEYFEMMDKRDSLHYLLDKVCKEAAPYFGIDRKDWNVFFESLNK